MYLCDMIMLDCGDVPDGVVWGVWTILYCECKYAWWLHLQYTYVQYCYNILSCMSKNNWWKTPGSVFHDIVITRSTFTGFKTHTSDITIRTSGNIWCTHMHTKTLSQWAVRQVCNCNFSLQVTSVKEYGAKSTRRCTTVSLKQATICKNHHYKAEKWPSVWLQCSQMHEIIQPIKCHAILWYNNFILPLFVS